ncbi:MAG: hypothetical protein V4735_08870 [Pseudomonadota bacterium]
MAWSFKDIRRYLITPKAEEMYCVTGTDAAFIPRIEAAMRWLTTETGKFGKNLIKEAYGLNDCLPLSIHVTPKGGNHFLFDPSGPGRNILCVGSEDLATLCIRDARGVEHSYEPERFLAHELTHGGQISLLWRRSTLDEAVKAKNADFHRVHPHVQAIIDNYRDTARRSSYERAVEIASTYYGNAHRPINEWIKAELRKDKALMKYLNQIEIPAIKSENHVAKLLGQPLRTLDYLDDHIVSRRSFVQRTLNAWGIEPPYYVPQTPAHVQAILDQQAARAIDPVALYAANRNTTRKDFRGG